MEGKWKVSLYVVAPPQAAAEDNTNSSASLSTTFRNNCAVEKSFVLGMSNNVKCPENHLEEIFEASTDRSAFARAHVAVLACGNH